MGSATGIQSVEAWDAAKEGFVGYLSLQRNKEPCTNLMEVSLSSLYWPLDSQIPFKSEASREIF